jgi:hypothetical protein
MAALGSPHAYEPSSNEILRQCGRVSATQHWTWNLSKCIRCPSVRPSSSTLLRRHSALRIGRQRFFGNVCSSEALLGSLSTSLIGFGTLQVSSTVPHKRGAQLTGRQRLIAVIVSGKIPSRARLRIQVDQSREAIVNERCFAGALPVQGPRS